MPWLDWGVWCPYPCFGLLLFSFLLFDEYFALLFDTDSLRLPSIAIKDVLLYF